MSDVAKRKLRETWRAAVAARSRGSGPDCLAAYDALVGAGTPEAEAAYRALRAYGLLWSLHEPYGLPQAPPAAGNTAAEAGRLGDVDGDVPEI